MVACLESSFYTNFTFYKQALSEVKLNLDFHGLTKVRRVMICSMLGSVKRNTADNLPRLQKLKSKSQKVFFGKSVSRFVQELIVSSIGSGLLA